MYTPKAGTRGAMLVGLAALSLAVTAAVAAPQKKPAKPKPPKANPALIAAGKKVYDSSGCSACHAIKGQGGTTSTNLTKVGAKRSPKFLEEVTVNPKKHFPETTMPAYKDIIKGKDLKAIVAYMASLK